MYDLHLHSCHSDGALSVAEILAQAQARGVKQLSITDHDTVAAYAHIDAVDLGDLRIIPGCEFSTQWRGRDIHIVGLNLQLAHAQLDQAMQQQARARLLRAEHIDAALAKLGLRETLAGALLKAGRATIGRPHFAQHLVDRGAVKSMAEAFKRYLGAGKAGDIKAHWPSMETACDWINAAGGTAVIAHPLKYKMTLTKLRNLIEEFKATGGAAIEVICSMQQPNHTITLADLATRYDLLASAGSDFHRPGQPWADLGRVAPLPVQCQPVWSTW